MRSYVAQQVSSRLAKLVFEMRRAARTSDPDSIHDLRVAIRRFSQSLRVFRNCFPRREVKRIRRRLCSVMDLAAEIRNRDITLRLSAEAGVPSASALMVRLNKERVQAAHTFAETTKRLMERDLATRWRSRL
jgi:CHAD domain-containing protein